MLHRLCLMTSDRQLVSWLSRRLARELQERMCRHGPLRHERSEGELGQRRCCAGLTTARHDRVAKDVVVLLYGKVGVVVGAPVPVRKSGVSRAFAAGTGSCSKSRRSAWYVSEPPRLYAAKTAAASCPWPGREGTVAGNAAARGRRPADHRSHAPEHHRHARAVDREPRCGRSLW